MVYCSILMFVGAKWHGARDGLDAVATASGRRGISHVPTDGCRFQRGTGAEAGRAAAFAVKQCHPCHPGVKLSLVNEDCDNNEMSHLNIF